MLTLEVARLTLELHRLEASEIGPVTDIKTLIVERALFYGVPPQVALKVAEGESRFNPHPIPDGDMGITCEETGKPFRSRGLYQLSECYYGKVPDACAYDARCAIEVAMPILKEETRCKSQFTACKGLSSALWNP
jgi:hypothetical protein